MFDGCRLKGRLFYLVLALSLGSGDLAAQSLPTTTVADVVFRGDGTTAGGVLLISWPSFLTSGGLPVAAGSTSTILGSGGALSVGLVPNVGAAPPSTYYTVVYQLDDASTPTKYSRYSSALHVDFPA